ncbi:MAG: universal stress protein [Actinomycetales bacterium]|nr:universal stress protein [Actinomycetales bacterium]
MSVVVGYVSTPEGEAALATGLAEAERRGVRLVVVLSDRGRFGAAVGASDDEAEQLRGRLVDTPVEVEVRVTTRGRDVAEDIVGAADEVGAQLIVVGLRRRTPMSKLLLGSNAQRILLDAACPVLAVKAG